MSIHLYDTTLRDGTQREGLSLSLADKLKIARQLDLAGMGYIEGGWPGSNPKDAEFFLKAPPHLRNAKLAAFGSTRHAGVCCHEDANIRALVAAGTPVVTLVGKSSTLHVERVLETSRGENLRMISESIAFFKRLEKEVIYDAEHFFDGYRLDPEYALATLAAAADAGADCLVLCDTNGGSLPTAVGEITRAVRSRVTTPLGIHTHNDGGLALANALAAIDAGCVHVQGTVNGYGERCGNMDLLQLIATLQLKLGYRCVSPEQIGRLSELSHFVAAVANLNPDAHAPYVGRSAFAHKGGIHVAAVAKLPNSYHHIDPALVGNSMRVVVSELSGRQNVRLRAHSLGLALDGAEGDVVRRIKELENAGSQFEAAEGSFEMLVRRAAPEYEPPFRMLDYTVIVEKRGGHGVMAHASVKLQVGKEAMHTAAEGDGPVNALDRAVRKALLPHYPDLAELRLVDYKVRIVDEHLGTSAKTRVMIESACRLDRRAGGRTGRRAVATDKPRDGGAAEQRAARDAWDGGGSEGASSATLEEERWSTVGCSDNIIEASWQALCDSFELALLRRRVVGAAERRRAGRRMEGTRSEIRGERREGVAPTSRWVADERRV